MGMFEDKRFAAGTLAVAQAVANATAKNGAKSIIGGGDSVKALNQSGLGGQSDLYEHRRRGQPGIPGRPGSSRRRGLERQIEINPASRPPAAASILMNKERKLIIAGNWKMNKTVAEALDLVRGLKIELGRRQGGGHRRLPAFHRAGRRVQGRSWIPTCAWARRT